MNEIVKRSDVVNNLEDVRNVAKLLAASGYFDAKGNAESAIAQLATKVLAGREMGFSPFASVNGIHVIQGKPTVSANLMAAAVKSSAKYDYRVRQMDEAACKIEFYERTAKGLESIGVSTFTADDARKAGTQNMAKFARNMLFARAMSNGVRFYCPDVFSGSAVYTPEEIGATVDGEGDVVDAPARVVDKATGEITEPVFAAPPHAAWQDWKKPADAYEWAVDNGATLEGAQAAFKSIVADKFSGKLSTGNAPQVFKWFYEAWDSGEFEQAPMLADPAAVGGAAYN